MRSSLLRWENIAGGSFQYFYAMCFVLFFCRFNNAEWRILIVEFPTHHLMYILTPLDPPFVCQTDEGFQLSLKFIEEIIMSPLLCNYCYYVTNLGIPSSLLVSAATFQRN